MRALSIKPLFAITLAVVICLFFYASGTKSPYILGIGLTVGILLSDAPTTKKGAVYSAIIAGLVSLYLILTNSFPHNAANGLIPGSLNVILFVCFGSLYGAILVWIRNLIRSGDRPFF